MAKRDNFTLDTQTIIFELKGWNPSEAEGLTV
jgi:hypothetical protein